MDQFSNPELLKLLAGLSPFWIIVGLALYALANVSTLIVAVLNNVNSYRNSKKIDATQAKAREINHEVANVSTKMDTLAKTITNGTGDGNVGSGQNFPVARN